MASQFGMKESYDFSPPTVKHHSYYKEKERGIILS